MLNVAVNRTTCGGVRQFEAAGGDEGTDSRGEPLIARHNHCLSLAGSSVASFTPHGYLTSSTDSSVHIGRAAVAVAVPSL